MKGSFSLLLAIVTVVAATPTASLEERQGRSFSISDVPIIGSLFGGNEEEPDTEIPHLGQHPLWKVHRYNGISLQPIPIPSEDEHSIHPVYPTLKEEAPSVVNVPNPHYAPEEHVVFPPNEYESHHAPSAPYPPSQHSAPYPPSQPSGPYPPSEPSAPYPSSHGVHSSVEVEHHKAPADQYNLLNSLDTTGHDLEGLSGLLNVLPSEMVHRLQEFMSTPEGKERASALLGIASNAQKLKSGASRSLLDVFNRFFGGAGGSTKVALQSGTYTNIPKQYPAKQGILTSFGSIGTGHSGQPITDLPEVPQIPKIPGLGSLPPTPDLPHINLPTTGHLATKGTTGKYVSINLPQPQETSHTYIIPEEHQEHSFEPSAVSYSVPAQTYSAPDHSYSTHAQTYSAPEHSYSAPVQTYSASAQTYSAPPQTHSSPAQTYSLPAPSYSAPLPQIPSTSYGTPAGPTYPYQHGAYPDTSFQPSQLQHQGYDSSLAGSENQEQVEKREEDEEVAITTPVTTKLQPVRHKFGDRKNLFNQRKPFFQKQKDSIRHDEDEEDQSNE